jgi:hypothetical protein
MISRRTFTAAVGAVALGLFARLRFAPSARGARGRSRLLKNRIAWGDFTFLLFDNGDLDCWFRDSKMLFDGERQPAEFQRFVYRSDEGVAVLDAKRLADDKVGVTLIAAYTRRDEPFEVTTGPFFWADVSGSAVVFCPTWPDPAPFAGFDDLELALSVGGNYLLG